VTVFLDNAREDTSEFRRPTFYDTDGNVASVVGLTVNPEEVEVIIPVIELAGFAEKPVAVQFVGEPASGYRLLDIAVEPNSVQVTGSPALIDGLRVETEPVDITGLSESQTLQVGLDLPDGVSMVEVQPIVVTVQIEPLLSSDVVRRPVEIRALGEGLTATVKPETVRVILFGPIPILNSLEQDDVRVTVDLLNLEVGTHLLAPFVAISVDSVEHRSTQPPVVTVIITNILSITNGLTDTESLTATAPLLDSSSPTSGSSSSSAFDLSASVVDAALPSGVAWISRRFS
jgi:YbbR domain-containing protein